jgi:hypothetical protein
MGSKGVTMDPLLRGVCEQCIDFMLEEGEIERIMNIVNMLDLPVASREDAALGAFMGTMYSQLDAHYLKMYNRPPKRDEIEEYHGILRRRAHEIKSKFRMRISQLEIAVPEASDEGQVGLGKDLEDYHLVLQKRTEELRAEKELEAEPEDETELEPESPESITEKIKFSYNSSIRKEPTRKILGIPTKRKEAATPQIR